MLVSAIEKHKTGGFDRLTQRNSNREKQTTNTAVQRPRDTNELDLLKEEKGGAVWERVRDEAGEQARARLCQVLQVVVRTGNFILSARG